MRLPNPSASRFFPGNRGVVLGVIAIVVLAAALRLFQLGTESYWLDEIIMVRLTEEPFTALVQELQTTSRPPVYVLLGYVWTQLFGTSEAATRSLSTVAGILSVIVLYAIGKRLLGTRAALIGSLLMAISAFQIWYSQEFRYYAVFQLTLLTSIYFYIAALKSGKLSHFLLFAFFSVIATYVHTYGVFLLAGLGLHFVLQWHHYPKLRVYWVVAQALILLGIAPQLSSTVKDLIGTTAAVEVAIGGGTPAIEWLPVPPLYAPVRTLVNFILIQRSYLGWSTIGFGAAALFLGTAIFAFRKGIRQWFLSVQGVAQQLITLVRGWDSTLILLLCWLIVPIVIPFVLSLLFAPMYLDRYVIAAAPAWYLSIAAAIYALRNVVPQTLSISVLALYVLGALGTYYNESLKEQWRETARYVMENQSPDDAIVLSYGSLPGDAFNVQNSFYWYYPGQPSDCYVDVRLSGSEIQEQMDACAGSHERLWLVLYVGSSNEELTSMVSRANYESAEWRLLSNQDFVGTSVYLFECKEENVALN